MLLLLEKKHISFIAEGILPLSVCLSEGMLSLCGLQLRGYCHCLSVRERILALFGLQQRGYCHYISAFVCLSERGCFHSVGYNRGDTATFLVTAEGMLQLCGLQQRGYCHSLGSSREYTATL